MSELSKLPNIGEILEKKLHSIGITTYEDLKKAGSRECFLRIKAEDSSACINMLLALEGAVQGIRWHNLDPQCKIQLKQFFQSL